MMPDDVSRGAAMAVMRAKGQITIPRGIRQAAHLEENDPVTVELTADGILLRPHKVIDSTQAWFWTPRWQAMEHEADDDMAAGRSTIYGSDESFIAHLRAVADDDAGA